MWSWPDDRTVPSAQEAEPEFPLKDASLRP